MLQKTFATIFLLAFFIKGFSQDLTANTKQPEPPPGEVTEPAEKAPAFTFSGSADVYYRYDFAKTRANNFTSFTNSHNSFELGMASVKLEYKNSKVSMVADLGFGKRAQEFNYTDN